MTYHYNGNDLFAGRLRLPLPLGVPNPVTFALLLRWFNSAGEDKAETKALVLSRVLPLPAGSWSMTTTQLNDTVMRILLRVYRPTPQRAYAEAKNILRNAMLTTFPVTTRAEPAGSF